MKIKNEEAVSPVIGVILMVAITVVLAAVLYVWASSFVQTGSSTPRATYTLTNPSNDFAISLTSVVPKADLVEVTMTIRTAAGMTVWDAETIDLYDFGQWTDTDADGAADNGENAAALPPNMFQGDGTAYDYTANPSTMEYAWGGYMYSDAGVLQTNAITFWDTFTNNWGPADSGGADTGQVIFVNNDASAEVATLVAAIAGGTMTTTPSGTFKLSAGDQYYVRGSSNQGSTIAGQKFDLVFDPTDETILSVAL